MIIFHSFIHSTVFIDCLLSALAHARDTAGNCTNKPVALSLRSSRRDSHHVDGYLMERQMAEVALQTCKRGRHSSAKQRTSVAEYLVHFSVSS